MKTRFFAAALLFLAAVSFSPIAEAQTAPIPSTFRVLGQVAKPTTFDLTALKKLPVTSENVTYFAAGLVQSHNFTGALLWDLLQSVGGIIVDPKVKNDILRSAVIITGSDGYAIGVRCRRDRAGIWRRSNHDRLCAGWPAARVRRLCEDYRSRRQDGRTLCFEYRQNRGAEGGSPDGFTTLGNSRRHGGPRTCFCAIAVRCGTC